MQVLVGPTYNMDVSASSSSPVCVMDRNSTISSGISASAAAAAQDEGGSSSNNNNSNDNDNDNDNDNNINKSVSSSSCLFLKGGNVNGVVVGDQSTCGSDDSSDSSSIGSPGDSEDEDEEEEEEDVVSSSEKGVGLQKNKFSMSSLEDSLTSKRGLSNHYNGKSKSFGNLTEVVSKSSAMAIKDLEKEENPFNKRRRLFIANKWSRKFFYSSRHNPNKSMPLLPILPDDDIEEEEEEEEENPEANNHEDKGNKLKVKMRGFKSQSCFCLADLAEEQELEDEDEDH